MTRWPSPAKLNLFLHIIGRRADGYHLLQTMFQLIDLCDELEFEPRNDGVISIDKQIDGVKESDNLVWRAATLLQRSMVEQQPHSTPGVSIKLHKHLPMGGGLGGGSSNAATTLVALNCIWDAGLTTQQLADLGLQLGADVPVFVHGYTAWGEGVGENLQPVELPERWFVVVHPGVHVSTSKLFSNSQLTRDSSPITIRRFVAGESVSNVFQELVCLQHPQVSKALLVLREAAEESDVATTDLSIGEPAMTGTGSCVFLACKDEQVAQFVRQVVVEKVSGLGEQSVDTNVFIARGLNQSPLNKAVANYRSQLSS